MISQITRDENILLLEISLIIFCFLSNWVLEDDPNSE